MNDKEFSQLKSQVNGLHIKLSESAQLKDALLQSLKDTNESLQKANKSLTERLNQKWSVVRIALSLVVVLFGVAFAQQALKAYQIWGLTKDVREEKAAYMQLIEEMKQHTREAKANSTVLAKISRTLGELAEGHSEFYQPNILSAMDICDKAIGTMYSEKRSIPADSEFVEAVDQVLFSALSLKGQCLFVLRRYHELSGLADKVLKLDKKHWLGHHYKAIYYLGTKRAEASIAWLDSSIKIKPDDNRDYLNRAEVYLKRRAYAEMRSDANMYLVTSGALDSKPVLSHYTVIASFFEVMGGFIAKEYQEEKIRDFIMNIRDGDYSHIDMKKKFDAQILLAIGEEIDKEEIDSISPEQAPYVLCLLTKFIEKADPSRAIPWKACYRCKVEEGKLIVGRIVTLPCKDKATERESQ